MHLLFSNIIGIFEVCVTSQDIKLKHFFCLLNCRVKGKANWKVQATWMHFHPLLARYLTFLFLCANSRFSFLYACYAT